VAAALPVFAQSGCTGTCLNNPLKFSNIQTFIEGVLQAVVMVALPIIVAFMVYAGFKYIFARGNPGEITKAHAILRTSSSHHPDPRRVGLGDSYWWHGVTALGN